MIFISTEYYCNGEKKDSKTAQVGSVPDIYVAEPPENPPSEV